MVVHQLKVMMNTSIPSQNGFVELTSDVVEYEVPKGKTKYTLSKYPFFDPEAEYPRADIQNLPYYKQIEIFFNEEKFKTVVLQSSNEMKNNHETDDSLYIDDDNINETTDRQEVNIKKNKEASNFEFTIKTILCTGFPPNNYFQSMQYYDSTLKNRRFTLKGTNWFSFLPSRFRLNFSYLRISNSTYTVHKVVWVNDALNHPRYNTIINSFESNNASMEKLYDKIYGEIQTKKDIEFNLFIVKLCLNTSEWEFKDDYDSLKRNQYISRQYLEDKKIKDRLKSMVDSISNGTTIDDAIFFKNGEEIKDEYKTFLDDFKLTQSFKNIKTKRPEWLFNKLILLQKNIEDYKKKLDEMQKKKPEVSSGDKSTESTKLTKHIEHYDKIQSDLRFLQSTDDVMKSNKKEINQFINENPLKTIEQYLSINSQKKNELVRFISKINNFNIQLRAIEYSRNNSDYTDDPDMKEIETFIQNNFKKYSELSNKLKELYTNIEISNPYWKTTVEQYYNDKGITNFVPKFSSTDHNILPILKQCEANNKLCKKKGAYKKAFKYLDVGLDKVKIKSSSSMKADENDGNSTKSNKNMYEAYLMVDVVEGKITPTNLSGLRCSYVDFAAGHLWRKMKQKTSENYITKDKFFISLKEQIAMVEEAQRKSILENNTKKQKASAKNNSTTRKKK
jgi:hypothetical protein